jgi:hypothetical protein
MRAQDLALQTGMCGFPIKWKTLEPEPQCVKMDQENDFQSQQWILEREPQQRGIIYGGLFAAECAGEHRLIPVQVIDFDVQILAGDF